jgi:signal transduction histidine kinase
MSSHAAIALEHQTVGLRRAHAVAGVLGAGAVATAVTVWQVSASPVLLNPESTGIVRGLLIGAWIAAGAYIWLRRPATRLGMLVVGAGFFYAATTLNASGNEDVFTAGRVLLAVFVVYLAYVSLCFPGDRLQSALERGFVQALGLATVVLWPLVLVFTEKLPVGGPLADCGDRCPANGFQAVSTPGWVSDALKLGVGAVTAAALLGIALVLVQKARSPTRLRRRAVEPLLYAFVALLSIYVVYTLVPSARDGSTVLLAAEGVSALLIPVAMLAGQAQARAYAAATLGQLVMRARDEVVTPARVQAILREVLGDPTLDLALWEQQTARYVDVDGEPLEVPRDRGGRAVTPVTHGGQPVALLVHNPSLDEAAGVLEGLAQTSLLLLEKSWLVAELRASRSRIVASADHERQRLERDLHDGAQQRLLLLQVKLARLRQRLDDGELAMKLDEIAEDAEAAFEELRVLAHGIYPPVLHERGVAEALRAVALEAPRAIRVVDHGVGRCSLTIEAALYFCALEAIQNAVKYAGDDARVTVELDRYGDAITLEVADDGPGLAGGPASDGIGLVTMRDRIGAVGGELEVISKLDAGVTVRASIADAPLREAHELREPA